jgi:hypothetical protein
MATVHVTLSRVQSRGETNNPMPVVYSVPESAQTMASTGVSQQSTLTATKNQIWSVTAKGDIFVAFGTNPAAASGAGHLVLAGQTRDFSVTAAGEKIAIKDAA